MKRNYKGKMLPNPNEYLEKKLYDFKHPLVMKAIKEFFQGKQKHKVFLGVTA